ncbi:MAG: glycerol kinase GlpK [Clostridia bacterium]
MKRYILALDQGTTSSRAILFDKEQNIIGMAQKELQQIYPQPGWVEEDPTEIYANQYGVMMEVLAKSGVAPEEIAGVGITNQRETTILWDKETGKPVYNAIVWQCRRTADFCSQLKKDGWETYIRENTGLLVDAYFSATKIRWILDHIAGTREMAKSGRLLFGTVDTWLIWRLTQGAVHATDVTNASRTMLYNIRSGTWDDRLLQALEIPENILPEVKSSGDFYGSINIAGRAVPICGVAGDQQAALFGQACFEEGEAKNTYGTGCFLLMNTGRKFCTSRHGLITTASASLRSEPRMYALEGSVFAGGAVIQWIRDGLGLLREAADSEYFARKVRDNGGVFIVPALTGLGAPYWDMYARGTIVGLTRGSNSNHIIRAALESIAFQTEDVLDAMRSDLGTDILSLKADGGASKNNFLMQFQADLSNLAVERCETAETTARGAAYLAGLTSGFWSDRAEIKKLRRIRDPFLPAMEPQIRSEQKRLWGKAVRCAMGWAE